MVQKSKWFRKKYVEKSCSHLCLVYPVSPAPYRLPFLLFSLCKFKRIQTFLSPLLFLTQKITYCTIFFSSSKYILEIFPY